jgi:glycosyltransferase involved in cell wall biosynthesis
MNILQIAPVEHRIPPLKYGGIERVVFNLVDGLVERGHAVTLLAPANSVTQARLIPLIPSPLMDNPDVGSDMKSREAIFASVVARAVKHISTSTYDIVHNHLGWRLLPFWQMTNSALISTLQTPLNSTAKRQVYLDAESTPIVSVSNQQRLGCPDLNFVSTIYNGIDLSLYELGRGDGNYLMFLGRISPEKGPVEAIQIAKALKKKLIMAAAILPWDEGYFLETVLPLIDQSQIIFVGDIDDQTKNKLLGGAEALLNPIQWEEPFGIVCVEALACGTPVATFRRGSMPEIIKDGITGIIAESVEEIIDRFYELSSIDRYACRMDAETRFTSNTMIENYLKAYSEIRL